MNNIVKILCGLMLSSSVLANDPATDANTTATPAAAPTVLSSNDMTITDAYVQPLIPGQHNTAAYMKIENKSDEQYILTGAQSSMAERTELHTVLTENGMVRMRPVSEILLLPNEGVLLQPGDLHIMLIGVEALDPDALVPICLIFKESATICMDVPVRDKRNESVSNTNPHAH